MLIITFDAEHKVYAGPKDTVKNRYDKNDPRNPACPCHVYQKKAEREFKKINERSKNEFISDLAKIRKTGDIHRSGAKHFKRTGLISFSLKKYHRGKRINRNRPFFLKIFLTNKDVACPKF